MEKQGQSEMMPRFVYIKCPVCGKHEFDYYRDDGDACDLNNKAFIIEVQTSAA